MARAGAGKQHLWINARKRHRGVQHSGSQRQRGQAGSSGLLLAARNIPQALSWAASLKENVSAAVEKGKSQFAGTEICGKTLGVVGLGAIGRKVAASASALGMNILGFDPYFTGEIEDVKIYSTIEDMLPECDYVTIHVPATDSTKG
ncbi:MAG: NAD(P)-dependent oxidoreductase, partial [Anaerovoracaceae bacterium]